LSVPIGRDKNIRWHYTKGSNQNKAGICK